MPISGRITEEDFNFLMERSMHGAVTASEKLRQMANFYRRYHENMQSYAEAVAEFGRLLEPYKMAAKSAENSESMRSELMDRLLHTLPELLATLTAAKVPENGSDARKALLATEQRAAQLTLDLLESILRMGLTRRSPTYNPTLFQERFHSLLELVTLASKNHKSLQ